MGVSASSSVSPAADGSSDGSSYQAGFAVAASKLRGFQPSTIRNHPYRALWATVLTLLSLLGMAGIKSYRDLATAQDIENDLRREISETQERLQILAETIDRIETDPATLERLAREELGMVREGDVVIVLPPDEDSEVVGKSSVVDSL